MPTPDRPALRRDAKAVQDAVAAVATCVEDRYVFAPEGAEAAVALRANLRAGRYADAPYGPQLAPLITADLQTVLPDLHLQVRWTDTARVASDSSGWDDPEFMGAYWAREALDNFGFDRAERLRGNVGLLVVRTIDEPEGTAAVVGAAFGFLARCSALIIDLRRTTGGAPTGVAHFLGHLLAPGTPLIEAVDRSGRVVERTSTPDREPTFGAEVPVFALIGRRTVSGCEELAYDLRAAGRATLVGATTIGAANPVDVFTVDPHLIVRVPTAFVRHVGTGGSWEGVGITPDVACAVDDAVDVAHRLAVAAVRKRLARGEIPLAEALLEELTDVSIELDTQLGLP